MNEKFNVHSSKKIAKSKKRSSDTSKNDYSSNLGKGQVYKNKLLNVDTTSGYGPSRRII